MTEKIIYVSIIVAGLVGFVVALGVWLKSERSKELPAWRRLLFSLGFLAVAAQLVLFALSWTNIGRDRALFAAWARFVYPSFFVAAVLVLMGKGPARWWLLASSFLLFVLCFFTMLSP
jgi:hypothetical protein